MTEAAKAICARSEDETTLSVRVPFRITRRGGRTRMLLPETDAEPSRPNVNDALVRALARAHRWQRMFETGDYATLTELAAAENITQSYLSRVLRLKLLAPDLVGAILDGKQADGLTLAAVLQGVTENWRFQEVHSCSGNLLGL